MPEIVCAFLRAEELAEYADPPPAGFHRWLFGFSDQQFKFCEYHFDGVEIGAVGRQKEDIRAEITDRIRAGLPLWLSNLSKMPTSPCLASPLYHIKMLQRR
jgi:hypothetical protein